MYNVTTEFSPQFFTFKMVAKVTCMWGIVAPIWVHWNRSLNVVSCNSQLRHRWVGGIWEPGFTLQTEPELWMVYCSNCYFQSAVHMFHTDLCSGSLTFWMQSTTGKLNIKSLCILNAVTGRAFKPWTLDICLYIFLVSIECRLVLLTRVFNVFYTYKMLYM